MKKTGKALSLVLSLALVVSSLTATFASAATSEGSTVTLKNDTVCFSNGSKAVTDIAKYLGSDNIKSFTSNSGYSVTDYAIKGIALTSGTSLGTLAKADTDSDGNVLSDKLTLTSETATGTIGVAARYQGTYTKADGTDVTVSGVSNLKISILKSGTMVYGGIAKTSDADAETAATDIKDGTKPAALGTLAKNHDNANVVYGALYVLQQTNSATDATADWVPQTVTGTLAKGDNAATTEPIGSYYVESSYDKVKVATKADAASKHFTLSIDTTNNKAFDCVTAQSVTLKSTMIKTAGSTEAAAAEYAKDDNQANWQFSAATKVENRVKTSAYNAINAKGGHTYISDTAENAIDSAKDRIQVDGLDINVVDKDVTVEQGRVGTITLSSLTGSTNQINVTTGNINVTTGNVAGISGAKNVTIANGNVGPITDEKAAAAVNINGGKVTSIAPADGVTDLTVNVVGSTKSTPATVGTITAATVVVGGNSDAAPATSTAGKVSAPSVKVDGAKAAIASIDANKEVTSVTYSDDYVGGAIPVANVVADKAPAITVDEHAEVTFASAASLGAVVANGKVTFNDQTSVAGISGTGTVVFVPGKLYTTDSISSVTMEVLGGKITSGMTLFTAPLYTVSETAFTPKGYTVAKVSGDKIDTFKVDQANFYGIVLNKTTDKLALNNTATYTASAYPTGTALPEGATIKMTFSGSDDYFNFKDNGNGTATLKATKMDNIFADLNKGTITATLYDQYGIELSQYAPATCNVTIVEQPAVSFTTDSFPTTMKAGQQYTVKITSADGTAPKTVFADGFAVVNNTTVSGKATFVTFTAKTAGEHGVYVSGNKVAVINVKGSICDTTTVSKKAGQPYTFKVTSPKAPTFVVAGIGSIKPSKVSGNDYYYTVKATATKGVHGVYVNGAAIALYTFA